MNNTIEDNEDILKELCDTVFADIQSANTVGEYMRAKRSLFEGMINAFNIKNRWTNGDSLVIILALAGTSQEAPTS
jgi:hypothetical protein